MPSLIQSYPTKYLLFNGMFTILMLIMAIIYHYIHSVFIYHFQNKAKTLKQWPRGQGNNKSINESTVVATSSTKNGTVATGGASK